jgi:hypothetical protein
MATRELNVHVEYLLILEPFKRIKGKNISGKSKGKLMKKIMTNKMKSTTPNKRVSQLPSVPIICSKTLIPKNPANKKPTN